MKYPYELISAYNDIADTIATLNEQRENLLVAICGMCNGNAGECDKCHNLCNFNPKED